MWRSVATIGNVGRVEVAMRESWAKLIVWVIFGVYAGRFLMPHYRATLGWKPVGLELVILSMICDQLRHMLKGDRLRRGFTVAVWGLLAAAVVAFYLF
jgi:hypothetical protein